MNEGIVWRFAPKKSRFEVQLVLERDWNYKYDGDDPDGETQSKLDSGEYVAFTSCVRVFLDDAIVGEDYLGGSVYEDDKVSEFWTAHRDPDPMNRNCSIMRAARGDNVCIGHYFPDMVSIAIDNARAHIHSMKAPPYLRH